MTESERRENKDLQMMFSFLCSRRIRGRKILSHVGNGMKNEILLWKRRKKKQEEAMKSMFEFFCKSRGVSTFAQLVCLISAHVLLGSVTECLKEGSNVWNVLSYMKKLRIYFFTHILSRCRSQMFKNVIQI